MYREHMVLDTPVWLQLINPQVDVWKCSKLRISQTSNMDLHFQSVEFCTLHVLPTHAQCLPFNWNLCVPSQTTLGLNVYYTSLWKHANYCTFTVARYRAGSSIRDNRRQWRPNFLVFHICRKTNFGQLQKHASPT